MPIINVCPCAFVVNTAEIQGIQRHTAYTQAKRLSNWRIFLSDLGFNLNSFSPLFARYQRGSHRLDLLDHQLQGEITAIFVHIQLIDDARMLNSRIGPSV